MTGHREQARKELTTSELEYIKERIRTGEKLDPKKIARELDVYHLSVRRIIGALSFLEKMTGKDSKEKAREGSLEKGE